MVASRTSLLALSALLLGLAAARSAGAQSSRPIELSVNAGATSYDASGTGTGGTGALRVATPLFGRWSLAEGSLGYASMNEQFTAGPTHVGIAEAMLQLQLPLGPVRPYVGAGIGWLHYLSNAGGRPTTEGTLSGAAGLRVRVARQVGLRTELRVRGWGGDATHFFFGSSAAEFTGGLTFGF